MTMDDAVTLVAVLPARPLVWLIELLTTAASAGAMAVMVALAGFGRQVTSMILGGERLARESRT